MAHTIARPRGAASTRQTPIDKWFHITDRGSNVRTEIIGGAVTFLTMSYILFVNPQILGSVADPSGAKLGFTEILTVTALVAGVMTLLMGIFGRFPAAIASGMGLNAYVAFGLVAGYKLSFADAMGVVVAEGLLITALVLIGLRQMVFDAIPTSMKHAISIGIGAFIAFIGLVNGGLVVKGSGTLVAINPNMQSWNILVFVAGLALTAILANRRVPGALLIGIVATTALATIINEAKDLGVWSNGIAAVPHKLVANPDFGLFGHFSFHFVTALGTGTALAVVLSVMMSDFFDTAGTVTGVAEKAGLLDDEGHVEHMQSILLVDSLAAAAGGAASASSNTTFIESISGVTEGARTGLASVVTGLLFLCCIFLSPLAGMVPAEATAPVLVIVGAYMFMSVKEINWDSLGIVIPAFVTILVMPLTYSITNGIGAGFLTYSAMALFDENRRRETHPLMYLVSAVFAWYFVHGAV